MDNFRGPSTRHFCCSSSIITQTFYYLVEAVWSWLRFRFIKDQLCPRLSALRGEALEVQKSAIFCCLAWWCCLVPEEWCLLVHKAFLDDLHKHMQRICHGTKQGREAQRNEPAQRYAGKCSDGAESGWPCQNSKDFERTWMDEWNEWTGMGFKHNQLKSPLNSP